jgi:flagellar basal-body rod protein FlgF
MENISYVGLSQQLALQQQMDITANNLANINTPGYKSQNVLFVDYLSKPKGGDDVNQVINHGTYRDLSTGSFSQTYNPLDVAIEGDAYFAVQTANGLRYTRDGGFGLNSERQIVNKSGYIVTGEGGEPISIPPEATHITISPEGEVSTQLGQVGRLKFVAFDRPQNMKREGENLLDAGGAAEQPVDGARIVQGMLEQSNVNPVLEMNKMIEVLRNFQSVHRMLQNDHERVRTAIQKLTRV